MKRKIGILTSGDYLFAGNICLNIIADSTHEYSLIDVYDSNKKIQIKQFKIFFLFGILGTIKSFYSFFRAKIFLNKKNAVVKVSRKDLYSFLKNNNFHQVVMINYPWRFDVSKYDNVINIHPGELPSYRGLMPICHTLKRGIKAGANSINYCLTAHYIDEDFDRGTIISENTIELNNAMTVYDVYRKVYFLAEKILLTKCFGVNVSSNFISRIEAYYHEMTWCEVFSLKLDLLRSYKYGKFLVNGGIIGFISWLLQILFYESLSFLLPGFYYQMIASVYMAFFFAMVISYITLRRFVFKKNGSFLLFSLVSFFMITIVGVVSQLLEQSMIKNNFDFLVFVSYPVAALIVSPLSYFIKNKMIFNRAGNNLS